MVKSDILEMENSNIIVPPHLNAEVYRSDTTGTSSHNYYDYVRFHADGSILIGCSELTGRYWNGGVYLYKSWEEFSNVNKQDLNLRINLPSSTADGCFIENSERVLLCEDNGRLSVWGESNVNCAWKQWSEEVIVGAHDDAVLAVDCLVPGTEYVSVGADGFAKVWDVNDMICVRNYANAHSRAIQSVTVKPNSANSQFATGSLDYYIFLWDKRTELPSLEVTKNDCGIRCLKWLNDNELVYGDDAGSLRVIDVRQPEPQSLLDFPAPVHQAAVQTETKKIAICCDNRTVTVCDRSSKVSYQNKYAHSNYVRCVTWDHEQNNVLYSSGWDGEVKVHRL